MVADGGTSSAGADHPTEGLASQYQPVLPRWRPPELAAGDLHVRAPDPDGKRLHDHGPGLDLRLRDLTQLQRAALPGYHPHRTHDRLYSACQPPTHMAARRPWAGCPGHKHLGLRLLVLLLTQCPSAS